MNRKLLRTCLAVILVPTLVGCASPVSESADQEPAPPAPGDTLPAGHPPVDTASQRLAAPPPGSGSGDAGLAWEDPAGWEAVTPSSSMRRAQYRVPGAAGDAEFVAFYFGPGEGGDAQANVIRWADQFSQPDGGSSRDVLVTEAMEVEGISVLLAEVTGTYNGGMAGMGGAVENLPGYMLLGAVAQGPDANWFFKFTGPEATVRANREQFMEIIRSLRAGA